MISAYPPPCKTQDPPFIWKIKEQKLSHEETPPSLLQPTDPLAIKLQVLLGPALRFADAIPESWGKHKAALITINLANAALDKEHGGQYIEESLDLMKGIAETYFQKKFSRSIAKFYTSVNQFTEARRILDEIKNQIVKSKYLTFPDLKDLMKIAKEEAAFDIIRAKETLDQVKTLGLKMHHPQTAILDHCFLVETLVQVAHVQREIAQNPNCNEATDLLKGAEDNLVDAGCLAETAYGQLKKDQKRLYTLNKKIKKLEDYQNQINFRKLEKIQKQIEKFILDAQKKYGSSVLEIVDITNKSDQSEKLKLTLMNANNVSKFLEHSITQKKCLLIQSIVELAKYPLLLQKTAQDLLSLSKELADEFPQSASGEKASSYEMIGRALFHLDPKQAEAILNEGLKCISAMPDKDCGKWLRLTSIIPILALKHLKNVNEKTLEVILYNKNFASHRMAVDAIKKALNPIANDQEKEKMAGIIVRNIAHSAHHHFKTIAIEHARRGKLNAALLYAYNMPDSYAKVRALCQVSLNYRPSP
jgi:hypothetical protein